MTWIGRVTWAGWLAIIVAAAFCGHIFVFAGRHTHSLSDLLYSLFPYWVPTFLLAAWIVEKTMKKP